jgi:hypothetical protein
MIKFITARDGIIYRAALFDSFVPDEDRFVAELDTPYGTTETVYFDQSEIEGLVRPAAMQCAPGYYVLRPVLSEDEIVGVERVPIVGWTRDDDFPDALCPLTLGGRNRQASVLCPDGQVVEFDVIYRSVDDYLEEARRFTRKTRTA